MVSYSDCSMDELVIYDANFSNSQMVFLNLIELESFSKSTLCALIKTPLFPMLFHIFYWPVCENLILESSSLKFSFGAVHHMRGDISSDPSIHCTWRGLLKTICLIFCFLLHCSGRKASSWWNIK